jgi:hypothetical protein
MKVKHQGEEKDLKQMERKEEAIEKKRKKKRNGGK